MTDRRRPQTYAFALLALVFLALGLYALNDISIYTPDSTRYLVWGRSLASFQGYVDRTLPEPVRYVVHAPLYAVLLVPAALFAPGSILAAKALTLAIGALLLWLAFRWFSERWGETVALVGCAILALNPLLFLYSTEILSDVPFAAAIVVCWLLLDRVSAKESFRPGLTVALALSVAAGLLLREIGISLLLSSVAYLVLRRRYREALVVILVPVALYAGWYVRNEIIIAPMEDPPLTNARILTFHFMTPRDASLLDEFASRALVNLSIYAGQVRDLLFAPVYFSRQYDVIPSQSPAFGVATAVASALRIPMAVFALVSSVAGLVLDFKASRTAWLRASFLVFYAGVALSYPINDIRFLLPLLLLSVYYCLLAWRQAGEWRPMAEKLAHGVTLVFLLPNLVWIVLYALTSAAYERDPAGFSTAVSELTPTHFTKPFRPAGEWISEHTPPGSVIMTQWKDLVIWVGERKVLNVDQTISVEEFENHLRDDAVGLVVSQRKRSGIAEFDIAMHQSRRYSYRLEHTVGSTEIYSVHRGAAAEGVPDRTAFDRSLSCLERGRTSEADSILTTLWEANRQNVGALYLLATAKALRSEGRTADSLFALLRTFPQAGLYVARASQQQQLLRAVASAATLDSSERADLLAGAAAGYWNAGWRTRAVELADVALAADPANRGAIVLRFNFALRVSDGATAHRMAGMLSALPGVHPLAPVLRTIIGLHDSLRSASTPSERARLYTELAAIHARLEMTEDAITFGREALEAVPGDPSSTLLVADLYAGKKRFMAARRLLEAARTAWPDDVRLSQRLGSLPPP